MLAGGGRPRCVQHARLRLTETSKRFRAFRCRWREAARKKWHRKVAHDSALDLQMPTSPLLVDDTEVPQPIILSPISVSNFDTIRIAALSHTNGADYCSVGGLIWAIGLPDP